MIARNEKRKRRQKVMTQIEQVQVAQQVSQLTLNAVLFQIIRQNAETTEGDNFDATKPAMLTVPMEDFKATPQDFGLQVKQDKNGNIIIIASVVEEKSNLTLPGQKIVDAQGNEIT